MGHVYNYCETLVCQCWLGSLKLQNGVQLFPLTVLNDRFFRFIVRFEAILKVLPLFRINTCMLLNRKLAALAFQSLSRFLVDSIE